MISRAKMDAETDRGIGLHIPLKINICPKILQKLKKYKLLNLNF